MQRLDKALLVVSFGTTHEETRARTIDAIEEHLAKAFPDRKLYRGWTSRMIVKRLREKCAADGADPEMGPVRTLTLEEALEHMRADGIRDVLVQPTHMIPGAENDRMLSALEESADGFEQILAGQPLLSTEEDREHLARALAEELLGDGLDGESGKAGDPGEVKEPAGAGDPAEEPRALVLMGHGSANKPEANRIYKEMQQTFQRLGYDNVFVATVEGTPALEDVLAAMRLAVKGEDLQEVVLAPLMIVAGDHAKNDMAGPEEDSWKNRLEAAGFAVKPVLRGLGEYPAVREMLTRHAREAMRITGFPGVKV